MLRNYLLLIAIVTISCSKKGQDQADSEPPVITLSSPSNGQGFTGGQTVSITGTVADNEKLRVVHLEIINTNSGAFVAHDHFYPDAQSYSVNHTFRVQDATRYKVKVEAEDVNRNTARTEIAVNSN